MSWPDMLKLSLFCYDFDSNVTAAKTYLILKKVLFQPIQFNSST
jgi:hypothetical protein